MSPPKHSAARRVPVATKLSEDMVVALDKARGDMSRSAWLAEVVMYALTADQVRLTPEEAPVPDVSPLVADELRVARARRAVRDMRAPGSGQQQVARSATCEHPESMRLVRKFGTWCQCGTRIR